MTYLSNKGESTLETKIQRRMVLEEEDQCRKEHDTDFQVVLKAVLLVLDDTSTPFRRLTTWNENSSEFQYHTARQDSYIDFCCPYRNPCVE